MFIDKLSISNFRNIKNASLQFDKGINIIYGENAQGKTNLLEIFYVFSHGKGFRSRTDKELLNFEEDNFDIDMSFFKNHKEENLRICFSEEKKKEIFFNYSKVSKLSEFLGEFKCVLFTPEDLNLVKEGPSEKRRFLDSALCQQSVKYFSYLINYNKILKQKNALLKDFENSENNLLLLDTYNGYLSKYGSFIAKCRFDFINDIKKNAINFYREISSEKENLTMKYLSFIEISENSSEKELFEKYYEILKKSIGADIEKGTSTFGIHKDDIKFFIDKKEVKSFASQGQQRSVVLSLKLAECENIKERFDEYPVLLLDDIMSELDIKRQDFIINNIKNKQVIITVCDYERYKNLENSALYNVSGGVIRKVR
ncbi:MAG: DNA replication/repair protein RecF [Clostridia bacterium]|nr:DNA replication/repair protein RecF [Clostridia bacterium]